MPTLRILYDVDGWAYQRRAQALQKYAPPDFEVSLAAFRGPDGAVDVEGALGERLMDVVFVMDGGQLAHVRDVLRARGWNPKVLGAWSNGWPRRIDAFHARYRLADVLVINNQECWDKTGRLPDTRLLPNGVDLDIFKVTVPLEARRARVLWTGSLHYKEIKGYEDYILPLQARLRAKGIDLDIMLVDSFGRTKRTAEEMADWYNTGTILVCASQTEGTPNPALEAAACGCVVVSTPVGNMPELIRPGVNGYLVERDVEALLRGIELASDNYDRLARHMQQDIQAWSWRKRSREYFVLFRELLSAEADPMASRKPKRKPDLAEAVTVFVSTVGAATFEDCLEHLCHQDCTFSLEIVDHVAPLSAALQEMLDRCGTPFFVQVDEDMLLYPDAIRTLHEEIVGRGPDVAIVVGSLYDAHLERGIRGVKIFRHELVRRYPAAGVADWVSMLRRRLTDGGYRIVRLPRKGEGSSAAGIFGLHGTRWTPESIYERYAALERRYRAGAATMAWFERYPETLLKRLLREPSELSFFALMGAIAGALAGDDGQGRDKDFRTPPAGLEHLRRFLEETTRRRGDTGA